MEQFDDLRESVAERLDGKKDWGVVFVGQDRLFPDYMLNLLLDEGELPKDESLIIGTHQIRALDKPDALWVSMLFTPKSLGGEHPHDTLRKIGQEPTAEQDLFMFIEPDAPDWAHNGVINYLDALRTGEGILGIW